MLWRVFISLVNNVQTKRSCGSNVVVNLLNFDTFFFVNYFQTADRLDMPAIRRKGNFPLPCTSMQASVYKSVNARKCRNVKIDIELRRVVFISNGTK